MSESSATISLHAIDDVDSTTVPCEQETVACDHGAEGRCYGNQFETVLQEVADPAGAERLLIVHVERCDRTMVVLRQQSWAQGIGWFTQSSVEIAAAQLGPLRLALQTSPRLESRRRGTLDRPWNRLKIVS